ncbi:hypothetical protein AOLI_G00186390 [Acnodon oligacanthus]
MTRAELETFGQRSSPSHADGRPSVHYMHPLGHRRLERSRIPPPAAPHRRADPNPQKFKLARASSAANVERVGFLFPPVFGTNHALLRSEPPPPALRLAGDSSLAAQEGDKPHLRALRLASGLANRLLLERFAQRQAPPVKPSRTGALSVTTSYQPIVAQEKAFRWPIPAREAGPCRKTGRTSRTAAAS